MFLLIVSCKECSATHIHRVPMAAARLTPQPYILPGRTIDLAFDRIATPTHPAGLDHRCYELTEER